MSSWPQALPPAPTDLAPPPQRPPLTCPRSASASRHSIHKIIGTSSNRPDQDLKRHGNLDLAVLRMWHKMSPLAMCQRAVYPLGRTQATGTPILYAVGAQDDNSAPPLTPMPAAAPC